MIRHSFWILTVALALFLAPHARAGIISVTGDVALVPMPSSISLLASAHVAFLYPEKRSYTVPNFSLLDPEITSDRGLPIHITEPGDYGFLPQFSLIPTGTIIDTHVLTLRNNENTGAASGTIYFDTPVMGIIDFISFSRINGFFEAGTTSLGDTNGLELQGLPCSDNSTVCDTISLSADRMSISFQFRINGFEDSIRIVTAVPEPTTLTLFAGCLFGLAVIRRRLSV
jgi:hypothetical protein